MMERICLLLFVGAVLFVAGAFSQPSEDKSLPVARLQDDFESGLAAWQTMGDAQFSVDTANPHAGLQSAHIVVGPETALAYQQIYRSFKPVNAGDEFSARAWVKKGALSGGSGAYLALEFVDQAGQRIGIAHSSAAPVPGSGGWEMISVDGRTPQGTDAVTLHLVLHAHGSAWFDDVEVVQTARQEPFPDLGAVERVVTLHPESIVQPHFGGVGFHMFYHIFPTPQDSMDTVIAKRWRELNPSFARLNHQVNWDRAMLDQIAGHLQRLRDDTRTEVYMTTWNPKDTQPGEERLAYARETTNDLEYWIKEKGATNIKTYCMTNELSLGEWGSLAKDLPKFKSYHEAFRQVFKERGLDIKLLATDASPFSFWSSIEWAAQNMDEITDIYGGHHYISEFKPDDPHFYRWFLTKLHWGAGMARSKGKEFILGEFGSQQDGRTVDGIKRDVCIYWDTPLESMVGIQLAECVIAAMNAGIYAMGYWTFIDLPDEYNPHYINKWGLSKRSGNDSSTRAHYYAYGLLTKFFRGPSSVMAVETNDPRVRAAAVRHQEGTMSIALVNRYPEEIPVRIALNSPGATRAFRIYTYDPAHVPFHPFGDLQGPSEITEVKEGALAGHLGPNTLTVYTTAYDDTPPNAIQGLTITKTENGANLAWQPNTEPDFCYCRVYRTPNEQTPPGPAHQIASTIATHYLDTTPPGNPCHYWVIAVDRSGNASTPAGAE
ncbi:MAG TPA: hypothetical protein PLI09_23570 [Candidatus Hydrogenedentes bacterium]|nr:hypothetical protein [Candidatus Hydrogenedentota bacterium]